MLSPKPPGPSMMLSDHWTGNTFWSGVQVDPTSEFVTRMEGEVEWLKLWDSYRHYGPKHVSGLHALVRVMSYPGHATCSCPKCDIIDELVMIRETVLPVYLICCIRYKFVNFLAIDVKNSYDPFFTRDHTYPV